MNNFFNKLRLKWILGTRAMNYSIDATEMMYQIYVGHSKVIHYRDGLPVYSLSSPALYSKPQAHFFARQLYKTIRSKNVPNLMSFAVNDECNANCEHCSFYAGVENKKEVLSLDQCKRVISDAQELGVSVMNFVGGEPLIREDLGEIINSVDKDLTTTTLFTNGFLLADRVKELKKSGLDSVYVSIDSADSQKHDSFRGMEGLFHKALAGIKKARSSGLSVGISCCMTPEAFKQGSLKDMIELGKRIGVHEVLIFPANPSGRYSERSDLVGNTEWIDEMIRSVKVYNVDLNYPGVLIYSYTSSHRSIGCSGGTCYLYISPYGDVCPCDFNHVIFGNILKDPLYKIWDRMTSLDDFKSVKWGGCKLKDPDWVNKNTVSGVFRTFDG